MTPYEGWQPGPAFRAVAQIGIGNLNQPVLRLDFRAVASGSGYVEFRLYDVDTGRTSGVTVLGVGAAAQWMRCDWLHTLDPPHTRAGTWRRVLLQARQSVGAPALSVWLGLAAGLSTSSAPGATPGGTWTAVTAPAGY
ncbi:hypothetical protein ACFRMQ_09525 [Kitasatospora sp. NPDC056783]|uniref:hypothetical protein n=1 Tax=Kitasatospora sp. NPDC056783 TaxID=3345943 RepID=UPI003699C0F8